MSAHACLAGAPKADLHVHLEGTIEPEMTLRLAERNGVSLAYDSVEALRRAYRFNDLSEFLAVFYAGLRVMCTEQDFHDVTYAFLERSARDNVVYAEIHVSAQGHVERGVSWREMMDGILGAAARAERELGVTARPILGLQRHRTEESALEVIEAAAEWRGDFVALGMGGPEIGNPPSKFVNAFARARDFGWKCTCHAGEEGPPEYVTEALDLLKVDRIDHGVRAVEDEALLARLAREQVPLTVCPYSNLKVSGARSLGEIKLKRLLEAGCLASVNTDDPSYFDAYMNRNLVDTAEALGLSGAQARAAVSNGFRGAFLEPAARDAYLARLERHWGTA